MFMIVTFCAFLGGCKVFQTSCSGLFTLLVHTRAFWLKDDDDGVETFLAIASVPFWSDDAVVHLEAKQRFQ